MGEAVVRENKKVIKLQFPIPVKTVKEDGSEEVKQCDTLTFGRLKAKHLKLLPASFMENEGEISAADLIPIIASVANIPEESADEIDLVDLQSIGEAMESFLSASLGTGKT